MKIKKLYLISCIALVLIIAATGCVAPPKDTSGGGTYTFSPTESTSTTPTSASYMTEVTPSTGSQDMNSTGSIASPTETLGYSTFVTPTPNPADKSCLINTVTQAYSYNETQYMFDLKNPPMYINYTVTPQNITGIKEVTSQFGSKQVQDIAYDTYDPQSYFVITVSNKTSGQIYLQNGFGTQYTQYLSQTLRVLDSDNMLIDLSGNKITATVSFWVKPQGNFDDPDNMTFNACTYWEGTPRANTAVALVTTTPIPTWAGSASSS
jgi:hypothetical protein